MEELLANVTVYNTIYENLFKTFLTALKKGKKREYFSFNFKNKEIKGRAILPEIEIDLEAAEKRALEYFRMQFEECKYYPNSLIKQMFLENFNELFDSVFNEDFESEAEIAVDNLVDTILESKLGGRKKWE